MVKEGRLLLLLERPGEVMAMVGIASSEGKLSNGMCNISRAS